MLNRHVVFLLSCIFVLGLPTLADADSPYTQITRTTFVGLPPIPYAPYGTYQTALKVGDMPTLHVVAHSIFGSSPIVSVDLSQLGLGGSTTISAALGSPNGNNDSVYTLGPLTIDAGVADGTKTIAILATDLSGQSTTAPLTVVLDSTPPALSLTAITFSTTSPRGGDYVYLSGLAYGTGSAVTIREISEGLFDANGSPLPGSGPTGDMIGYDPGALQAELGSTTGGPFTNVAVPLFEFDPGQIQRATSFRIRISAYDEAGNFASSTLTVPVPRPAVVPTTCAPSATCVSNVLFLPGIEGSRLYRPDYVGGSDRLWEPDIDGDVRELYLNSDGSSVAYDIYTKTRDVIDELPNGKNIYKSFVAQMNELRTNGTITDWEPIAYDWRLSLDDLLTYGHNVGGRIYYSGDLRATSSPYILQELKRLAASSKTGKVSIVAHSNGGLLAKRLTELLGAIEAGRLIDQIIFVAVPQIGTPAAIAAGLHGYAQDHVFQQITSRSTARTLALNSPMVYNLLPSAQYFTYVDDPVVRFDYSLPDWVSRYGGSIHSSGGLHQFLTDSYGRVDPQTGNIDQPTQLNNSLLTSAEALHVSLDAWQAPVGIALTQIAGWGVPKTVSGVRYATYGTQYANTGNSVRPDPDFTIDGDGTVVVPSALWISTTTGAQNYWINLDEYNKFFNKIVNGTLLNFDHGSILAVGSLREFVVDTITRSKKSQDQYEYLSTVAPTATDSVRLRYSLHSPLTLNLYDAQGRHTGVSTTTGHVEEQIPGTYYTEFGDVKYLFTDASSTARVVMNGYAQGTFTFNVDQYKGNALVASTTFKDIPTTASTTVTLGIQADITTLSHMSVDKNGDGADDLVLAPKMNDIATLDTTPPEMRIIFNTLTSALVLVGTDDVSTPSVTATTTFPALKKGDKTYKGTATTTATVRDAAGNTTKLIYTEQLPSPAPRDTIIPLALVYNGATTTLTGALVSYKWRVATSTYGLFAATLRNASTTLESHWRPKKSKTIIMLKPQELDDSDTDDAVDVRPTKITLSGMVIPYLTTQKGSIVIGY